MKERSIEWQCLITRDVLVRKNLLDSFTSYNTWRGRKAKEGQWQEKPIDEAAKQLHNRSHNEICYELCYNINAPAYKGSIGIEQQNDHQKVWISPLLSSFLPSFLLLEILRTSVFLLSFFFSFYCCLSRFFPRCFFWISRFLLVLLHAQILLLLLLLLLVLKPWKCGGKETVSKKSLSFSN
jgi:hypothetical protein